MPAYDQPILMPAGDLAVVVEYGDEIDPEINSIVHRAVAAIEGADIDGVVEVVPTYRSALVYYDPFQVTFDDIAAALRGLSLESDEDEDMHRIVEIPTLYGGDYGPDLPFVASNAGMSEQDVVEIHSGTDYLVYAMGFSPGFPYLGGLDPRLDTPRLKSPRTSIPAGSVGIAETQTGVYPVASPGGWQLIGRTPIKLFDSESESPAAIHPGDRVRFVPIEGESAFEELGQRVEDGSYVIKTRSEQ